MTCTEARELAGAHLNDELPAAIRREVLEHRRRCWECARWTGSAARLKDRLRDAVRRIEAPAALLRALELRREQQC